jgi:hypothetical protein
MAKAFAGASLAILAVALAGCSPAPVMERVPTELGGLPAGAPPPPRTPYRYPAVHDTPPPRATAPLTSEEQLELEKRLRKARQRQESQTTTIKDTPPVQSGGAN